MIRITMNLGSPLILSMLILCLIILLLHSSCARTLSTEDRALIQSVSISIDEKAIWPLWDTRNVDPEKLNEDVKGLFGIVGSFEKPGESAKPRTQVYKGSILQGAYSIEKDDPTFCVFYDTFSLNKTYPSYQVLRFQGPYANDPSIKEYWDTMKSSKRLGISFESMVKYIMKKENINALEIIREEFSRELKDSGLFPSIVSEGGDAQIKLKATFFGIYTRGSLTRINLSLAAEIIRADVEKFWLGSAGRGPFDDDIPAREGEEYLNSPDLIIKDLKNLSQIVSAQIINKARGEE
jgi:hypothetical protein